MPTSLLPYWVCLIQFVKVLCMLSESMRVHMCLFIIVSVKYSFLEVPHQLWLFIVFLPPQPHRSLILKSRGVIQGSLLRPSIPKSLICFMLTNGGFLLQVEASWMSFTDALIYECGDLSLCSFSRIMVSGPVLLTH